MADWYLSYLPKELCCPAGAEGLDLVIADHLLSLLPKRCHPQVQYMDTFSVGPTLAGHIAC